jgi:hypothetical protein
LVTDALFAFLRGTEVPLGAWSSIEFWLEYIVMMRLFLLLLDFCLLFFLFFNILKMTVKLTSLSYYTHIDYDLSSGNMLIFINTLKNARSNRKIGSILINLE